MPFVPGICWRVGCISGGRAERQHTPSVGIRGQYLGGPELVKRFFPQLWGPGDAFGCGTRITGSGISLGFEPRLPADHRQVMPSLQVSVVVIHQRT